MVSESNAEVGWWGEYDKGKFFRMITVTNADSLVTEAAVCIQENVVRISAPKPWNMNYLFFLQESIWRNKKLNQRRVSIWINVVLYTFQACWSITLVTASWCWNGFSNNGKQSAKWRITEHMVVLLFEEVMHAKNW